VFTAADTDQVRRQNLLTAGARVFTVPSAAAGVDLEATLRVLADQKIRSILCEGGGRLAAALIESDSVDRVYLFVAPRFLGSSGTPAFPVGNESGAWALTGMSRFGKDALLILDRNPAGD
jgi:diaminohydroxyphosphoribosylaminopyrimidine deaminase/5-amino-6-(5-phosphoribosylamino)uracil reductase